MVLMGKVLRISSDEVGLQPGYSRISLGIYHEEQKFCGRLWTCDILSTAAQVWMTMSFWQFFELLTIGPKAMQEKRGAVLDKYKYLPWTLLHKRQS